MNRRQVSLGILVTIMSIIVITGGRRVMGDTPSAGDSRTDDKGIAQVFVPPGCFIMGTDYKEAQALIKTLNAPSWVASALQYESPARETCLTKGYWIDTYEVTNKAYGAFVEDGGYTTEAHWSPDGLKWLKRQNVSKLPLP
ncbi:MAG TPA: SUMF1/EgtB/PvdO family nonheme iron enzyme, partial [Aggregatilineales bacterium]|nr:SUMF1/EgtB/PvdO family nonheme iron enzyme [Aggregatilineales bacterium]